MHKLLDSEKNRYTFYGALFGLLFPLAATSFEAVKGTLAVDGTLGSGSRFRVELPEAQAP